jgi:hypothetical protein
MASVIDQDLVKNPRYLPEYVRQIERMIAISASIKPLKRKKTPFKDVK